MLQSVPMDLNFKEKSRILVNLPNGHELSEAIRHCFDKNLTVIPVDPNLPEDKISYITNHCEANYRIDTSGVHKISDKIQNEDGIFLIVYTSGSTGDPKGVMLSKKAVIDNAKKVGKLHGFDVGKRHATCLPLYHCNAICMSLVGTYLYNQELFLLPKFNARDYVDLIKKNNISTASITPAMLTEMVENEIVVPECLEYMITAAAPLTSDVAKKFYGLNGPRLVQGYGLSEAVNFSFVMPKLSDDDFVEQYIENYPPVGLPLEGTEVRLVDTEVWVKGPNMMSGYLKNKQKTEEIITKDGFLRTGDIGSFRGDFLVLEGRIKDIINRGGETIYPKDVEDYWRDSGIDYSVAFGVANNVMGDEIGLWTEHYNCSEITRLSETLDKYKPATVQTGTFAKTSVGKVQRKKMADKNISINLSFEKIESLIGRVGILAEKIVGYDAAHILPRTSSDYIYHEAEKYLDNYTAQTLGNNSDTVFASIGIMENSLANILHNQKSGEEVMKENKGMWRELMNGFPMGSYATLCAEFLIKRKLLEGRVLELGAGIGNTSNLIEEYVNDSYIRSDYALDLNKGYKKGQYMQVDFNYPLPVRDIDTIFAVNALHCANDKGKVISYAYDALNTNGVLVIGEGQKNPYKDKPWVLNIFYGMFTGWWDKGGFLNRIEWIEYLERAGFTNIGWSKIRAGRYDFGGIIWGEKK